VRAEKLVDSALDVFEGVDDIEVGRGLVGRLERLGVCGDLAERRSQPRRVARQHRPARVRQELPLPRDGELDDRGEERRQKGQSQTHDDQDGPPPPPPPALPPPPPAPPRAAGGGGGGGVLRVFLTSLWR